MTAADQLSWASVYSIEGEAHADLHPTASAALDAATEHPDTVVQITRTIAVEDSPGHTLLLTPGELFHVDHITPVNDDTVLLVGRIHRDEPDADRVIAWSPPGAICYAPAGARYPLMDPPDTTSALRVLDLDEVTRLHA